MYYSYKSTPSGIIIRIHGEINKLDAPGIRKTIFDFQDFQEIVLDLSGVTLVDSAFIGLLFELKSKHPSLCRKIRLVNPNEFVSDTLILTDLYRAFDIVNAKNGLLTASLQNSKTGKGD
jgi:anti-anti-sigma factor